MDDMKKDSITKEFIICLLFATILHWGLFEFTNVPTPSMENTIKSNSSLLISKIHYGPRIPITPLQVPLTHQTIPFLGIKSYLDWIKIPYYRLPGITSVKRNDIVVFNTPNEDYHSTQRDIANKYPLDLKTFYVKRCLGLPGEKIKMINNNIFINDEKIENDKNSLCLIKIKFTKNPQKKLFDFFKKNNIDYEFSQKNNFIKANIDKSTKEALEKEFTDLECTVFTPQDNHRDKMMFIRKLNEYKNISNWSEFLIPQKGMEIEINKDNLKKYGEIIQFYDSNEKVKIQNGELFINNKKITKYIFNKNYYFMLGDNRMNSTDSRFFGPVPEDHIYAKVLFIFGKYYKIFTNILLAFIIIYLILIFFFRRKNN